MKLTVLDRACMRANRLQPVPVPKYYKNVANARDAYELGYTHASVDAYLAGWAAAKRHNRLPANRRP
jgi:hypothetical protein